MKGFSHTYTCIHSTPRPPSIWATNNIEQSSICYKIVPCWLSIFKYSSVYMTFPKSLTLPSPLATISSFSKSVSLFLFCKFICIISFQIPHTEDVIWYFSFFIWLTSLIMTLSRSIHVAENGIISFFLMAEYTYIYHIFFIHYTVNRHLGSFHVFHVLAMINSAAMNIGVHISFWVMFFLQIYAQEWDYRVIW